MHLLSIDYSHWGAILKRIRKELDLSQEQFASILHISQTLYSEYELSKKEPPESILEAIFYLTNDDELYTKLLENNAEDISRNHQMRKQLSKQPRQKLTGKTLVMVMNG